MKERVSNSSMGHQKWQPQVFLDINAYDVSVDWVSQHLVGGDFEYTIALWKLTYESKSMSTLLL